MDVAAYVKNVLSAYRNASSLVKRVQEKRSSPDAEAAQDEQLSDLADSLALGPPVIDGQYKHELKRFGEAYACGDAHARDQMKDILITLQMAVMSMQNVVLDEGPLDYPSLQSASDDSRVNAVVCLGQLSQRISAAVQAKTMLPYNGMPYPTGPEMMPLSPSLQYSSSRSTNTSGSTPMTPDFASERTAVNSFGHFEPKPLVAERAPSTYSTSTNDLSHRRMTNPRGDQHVSPPLLGATQLYASDSTKSRRPSSQALAPEDTAFLIAEGQKLSPQSSQAAMSADTASLISGRSRNLGQESPEMARATSRQTDRSRDRYGPDDFGDMAYNRGGLDDPKLNYNSLYENRDSLSSGRHASDTSRPRQDTQSSDHSTLEHIAFLQSHARAPTIDDYRITSPTSPSSMTQPSQPPPRPPIPHERTPSLDTNHSNGLALPTRPRAPSTNSQDRDVHPAYRTMPHLDSGRTQDPPPSNPALAAYQAKLQYYEAQRTRKPIPSRADRPSISAPIPVNPEGPPQSQSSTFKSLMPSLRRKSPHPPTPESASAPAPGVHAINPTPPLPTLTPPTLSTIPLNLPTESNTLNFCKGAFKLQAGLPKKAFALANRPSGMTGVLSFWQCSKCAFEGPVIMHTPPPAPGTSLKKPAKAEKIFDPRVRVGDGGGVRYKWVFLAKSHVSCKSVPEGEEARRGEFGAFACLFCCAEGRARGWEGLGGGGVAGAAPIFGNVGSFMEHLAEVHRKEAGWPGVEMLGRGRAVVGRVAGPAEEWDVNFVPL